MNKTVSGSFLARCGDWAFGLSAALYLLLILWASSADRYSKELSFSPYIRYHQESFLLLAFSILLSLCNRGRLRLLYEILAGAGTFLFIIGPMTVASSPRQSDNHELGAQLLASLIWLAGIPLLRWRNASVMLWFAVCGGLLLYLLHIKPGDSPLILIIENLAAILLVAGVLARIAAAIQRHLPPPRPTLKFPKRDY